jgi:hypothetical protein
VIEHFASTISGRQPVIMNLKPALVFALALCVGGCSTLTTSHVDCTRLSRERQQAIGSDLDRVLASHGFTPWPHPEETRHVAGYPITIGCWYAPLQHENAEFTVSAFAHSHEMWLEVDTYRLGLRRANIAITKVIVACIQSNAPDARIQVQEKTEFSPRFPPD